MSDTSLIILTETPKKLNTLTNKRIQNIEYNMTINQLKLKEIKTKHLIISKQNNTDKHMNNHPLEDQNNLIHLGFNISNGLK